MARLQAKRPVLFSLIIALGVMIITAMPTGNAEAAANKKYASIVMDADTGMILHQRYADKSLHPASLTKVMTLLLLFEDMERGKIRLDDRIYISKTAASMVPSKLGLAPGTSIRVRDAINALAIKSANDIAVAVAEHIGGKEEIFARMMTRRAHELGMSRTYFKNASGLHNKFQVSTARDMAKLAKFVIDRYPHYYRYYSRKSFEYDGVTYRTHNKLMKRYRGMDGMKTGYISASGFNLIASAKRDGHRLIGVVFGGRTSRTRNDHMEMLLNRGFKRMQQITVASMDAPKPERKPNLLVALDTISNLPAFQNQPERDEGNSRLLSSLQGGMFAKLIGEGDLDPSTSSRLETGLIAIAAHQGQHYGVQQTYRSASSLKQKIAYPPKSWTIQVGAFSSRAQTEQVLRAKNNLLPVNLRTNETHIAPLRTNGGWLFRGRISGYDKVSALRACRLLNDCITIPPK